MASEESLGHPIQCCCSACMEPVQDSTSDPETPDPPGQGGATKAIYSMDEVIYALRTADGAWGSVAWGGNDIDYSINTGQASAGDPGYSSEHNGYVNMSSGMEEVAAEAFELWDEVVAINLNPVADDPGADITFNYSSNTSGNGTYAQGSYTGSSGGRATWGFSQSKLWFSDSWWTHDQASDLYDGGYGVMTYLHEIGHALGLSHPGGYNGSGDFADDATHFQDTRAYTLMSYFNANENGSGTDHGGRYAATPLLHDILTVQAVYGADMTTRVSSTTYGFNSTANRDAFDFTKNTNPVVAIWDAGGTDKIDVSGWWTDQIVDLREGAYSSVGYLTDNLAIAYGAQIEQAAGGSGDDQLIGNALNNVLTGNDGDDTLTADEGADVLFGGGGGDTLDGGDGVDWVRYSGSNAGVTVDLGTGTGSGGDAAGDSLTAIENISGSDHGDALIGDNNTSNQLFGYGGNDILSGRAGHDFMLGHAGDDSIYGGTGRDILRGGEGADHLDGGSEHDWIQYNDATAGVALDLSAGVGTSGDAAGDTFVSIENIRTSAYDDVITGDGARNIILAGAGDDWINGGGGPDLIFAEDGDDTVLGSGDGDTIYGGAGADSIDGGGGNDWAMYLDAAAGVAVDLMAGIGTLGDAAGDILTSIEWLWGSDFNDTLGGDNAANMLRGGDGDDTLTGNGGNDVLEGHGGDDTFVFNLNDGIDRIHGFETSNDIIRIIGAVTDFGQLTITSFRGDAAITYDAGDAILLTGISVGEVTSGMFEFV